MILSSMSWTNSRYNERSVSIKVVFNHSIYVQCHTLLGRWYKIFKIKQNIRVHRACSWHVPCVILYFYRPRPRSPRASILVVVPLSLSLSLKRTTVQTDSWTTGYRAFHTVQLHIVREPRRAITRRLWLFFCALFRNCFGCVNYRW